MVLLGFCFQNGLVLLCLVSGLLQGLDAELKHNIMLHRAHGKRWVFFAILDSFILDTTDFLLWAKVLKSFIMVVCLPLLTFV